MAQCLQCVISIAHCTEWLDLPVSSNNDRMATELNINCSPSLFVVKYPDLSQYSSSFRRPR